MTDAKMGCAHAIGFGRRRMSGSAKRLYRKASTSSSVSGPPRFKRSTPTRCEDEGEEGVDDDDDGEDGDTLSAVALQGALRGRCRELGRAARASGAPLCLLPETEAVGAPPEARAARGRCCCCTRLIIVARRKSKF
mmetsp:Transcript_10129/g.20596  ORF Transcript_10129/g.20596 Transcript_10129/m.20596 type:complete len:136 (+) Transcript_10129:2587-2994(+)